LKGKVIMEIKPRGKRWTASTYRKKARWRGRKGERAREELEPGGGEAL